MTSIASVATAPASALPASPVRDWNKDVVASLSDAQVSTLSQQQIATLSADAVSGLSGSQLSPPAGAGTHGLEGKTAIVTGAGSGIGRATTTLFIQVGARVLFVYRRGRRAGGGGGRRVALGRVRHR